MLLRDQLRSLEESLSADAEVLTDPTSESFQTCMLRWSDIGRKAPKAIVLPKSEEDCQATVKWAVASKVPFVVKSGGMSLYSTIGEDGIIIDLTKFAAISHDKTRHEAVLTGGVTSKVVATKLAEDGHCTTIPSSNAVGAIPFFLNGGNSPLVAELGYGSDNIISARMITATGDIVDVSETENQDLLYAIRGAGQYLGLVTYLTIRTYPFEDVFGNAEGTFWSGRFVFPIERANEVSQVMESIVDNDEYCIGGFTMVAAAPPALKPAVAVMPKLIHPDSESLQKTIFKPLYDLGPVMSGGAQLHIEQIGDAMAPLMTPGGFKKLRLTGMVSCKSNHLAGLAQLWQDLVSECPDGRRTVFGIAFESQISAKPAKDSANCMHDTRFWASNLVWCGQEQNVQVIERYLDQAQSVVREGQAKPDFVEFTNSLRAPESPLEHRYRDFNRLQKLQELKRKWDPTGLFSNELL